MSKKGIILMICMVGMGGLGWWSWYEFKYKGSDAYYKKMDEEMTKDLEERDRKIDGLGESIGKFADSLGEIAEALGKLSPWDTYPTRIYKTVGLQEDLTLFLFTDDNLTDSIEKKLILKNIDFRTAEGRPGLWRVLLLDRTNRFARVYDLMREREAAGRKTPGVEERRLLQEVAKIDRQLMELYAELTGDHSYDRLLTKKGG